MLQHFLHLQNNPFYSQKLIVFGRETPSFQAGILPLNSPMKSIFDAGITKLRESGTVNNLQTKWEGTEVPQSGGVDKQRLTSGQTVLVYFLLSSGCCCCLVVLVLERLYYAKQKWFARRQSDSFKFGETLEEINAMNKQNALGYRRKLIGATSDKILPY